MQKTIYYHDTDAGGVVYYANYLKYMEEARTDLLREKGLREDEHKGQKIFYPVINVTINYRKPAYYGETILCSAAIKDVSRARITFSQKIVNADDNSVLVEGDISVACVDETFHPMPIPKEIRVKLGF